MMRMSSQRCSRRLDGRQSHRAGLKGARRRLACRKISNRLCRSPRIHLMRTATFQRGRSSAARICTPRFPWMGARRPAQSPRCVLPPGAGDLLDRPAGEAPRPLDFLVVADHSDNMGFFPDSVRGQARDASPTRPAANGMT